MNVNNSLDTKVYNLIKRSLDASALKSRVSANNIANINTKDYKAYHVSFEETLNNEKDNLEMKTDNERHIKDTAEYGDIEVKQDTTSAMNQDGNNVDIENEMVNQAANALMYNALVTRISNKLSTTSYVINGGR